MRKTYLIGLAVSLICISYGAENRERHFVKRYEPLLKIPSPRILTNSVSYSETYAVERIIDGNPRTEYSSKGDGTNTFIEFDFGATFKIAAFRHLDRNDPATVAESVLIFRDASGKIVTQYRILHSNRRNGLTFFIFPQTVTARTVRWQVSKLGPQNYGTVGGAEIEFFEPGEPEEAPSKTTFRAEVLPMIEIRDGARTRTLKVTFDHPYARSAPAFLRIESPGRIESRIVELKSGVSTLEIAIPSVPAQKLNVTLDSEGKEIAKQKVEIFDPPVKEIYILPHSHVDIGYTAIQPDVVKKQNENIDIALELIKRTSNYPEGSKFVWNVEVLWPVENYLRDAPPQKKKEFINAVKEGRIGLDAFYGNILTGLCRQEELIRMMTYATKLSEMWGVKIESAMISDVPGYTWSTVSALAQASVKYFSFAPNYFDRMGLTMATWQDKPFWWIGPDNVSKVLCWCPTRGYALGHLIGPGEALARFLPQYLNELKEKKYPYDITCIRWNVHGDNGAPDEQLSDVVRAWNERYSVPRLIITTTADAFRKFEQKYGKSLPQFRGDYTPYWEDGAGSSAFETAMNRASAERLVQAETLHAIRNLENFDASAFYDGWRNVLLYSEHTWGAHNSVSEPDTDFVKEQWRIKRGFALDADNISRKLMERALAPAGDVIENELDVYNTSSWWRTDLVTVPAHLAKNANAVFDSSGKQIPAQKLSGGELLFVAEMVQPFGAKRYRLGNSETQISPEGLVVKQNKIEHPMFTIGVDDETGAIVSLISKINGREYVNPRARTAINDYFYLIGSDIKKVQRVARTKISVKESGPLVGSLLIESEAPGCKRLIREIRVVNGLDRIELINTVEKLPVRKKEGVHFGFGFDVPDGIIRMDVGFAAIRPDIDQIPAACKNWFSVQRWIDISNDRFGILISPVDAPLVEVGDITATLIGSQSNPEVWLTNLPPSSIIYSWVMNNHWHTNYRAEQDDTVVFRYILRPHEGYSPITAARFGIESSQPLLVCKASAKETPAKSRVLIEPADVIATVLKPSDDGKALILRLFAAGGKPANVRLYWNDPQPKEVFLSDASERPIKKIAGSIHIPAWGIATIRARFH